MNVLNFLKNKRNLSRDFQQEWKNVLIKKPEFKNPNIWPDGLKRLYEVQKNIKSDIFENLKTKYPDNIKKEVLTKTDSGGYEYEFDSYLSITLCEKIRDLFRKEQKYATKNHVMNLVHNKENSKISRDPDYIFIGKKVD